MTRALSRSDAIREINGLRQDLISTLDEIEDQRKDGLLSVTHQSFLNDYAVVRMAGFLEQLCFHAISGRVGEITDGHVQLFLNSWFYKSPNLTASQFRDLFKRFGPEVDAHIMRFLDQELNRELLNSLLEIRNGVAHGKDFSRTSRQSLQSYRTLVLSIDSTIHDLLLSSSPVI